MLNLEEKIFLLKMVMVLSYLVFPVLIFCLYRFWKKKSKLAFFLILLSLLFIWARFLERNLITVQETAIEVGFDAKIALIADLHVGVFKDEIFLARVVEEINALDVEMVLIAGDFSYEPAVEDLDRLFAPLQKIKFPVYGVLGNHDVGFPGLLIRDELVATLEKNGVMLLNNKVVYLDNFNLIGLGSHFAREDEVSLLNNFSEQDNVVVLAHNPDTTNLYQNHNADLTLTGHTHGGQVRIPWIYKKTIPTKGDFDQNLTQEKFTKLFVTSGLGEVLLPLRFLNPPVIDVLVLK